MYLANVQGKLIRLVPPSCSKDLITVVDHLREEIMAGRIVGLAWVEMHKVYDYSCDVAGECRRAPTLTRGMVAQLHDALADMPDRRR